VCVGGLPPTAAQCACTGLPARPLVLWAAERRAGRAVNGGHVARLEARRLPGKGWLRPSTPGRPRWAWGGSRRRGDAASLGSGAALAWLRGALPGRGGAAVGAVLAGAGAGGQDRLWQPFFGTRRREGLRLLLRPLLVRGVAVGVASGTVLRGEE